MKRIFTILLLVMPLFVVAQNDSGLKKGYKGFFDLQYAYAAKMNYGMGLSTTHGWQFNQHFYAGAGFQFIMGFQDYCYDWFCIHAPLYADFRYTPFSKRITPYVDVKIGTEGFENCLFSPSIGCRFRIYKKLGVNIGVGYYFLQHDRDVHAINATLGVDF